MTPIDRIKKIATDRVDHAQARETALAALRSQEVNTSGPHGGEPIRLGAIQVVRLYDPDEAPDHLLRVISNDHHAGCVIEACRQYYLILHADRHVSRDRKDSFESALSTRLGKETQKETPNTDLTEELQWHLDDLNGTLPPLEPDGSKIKAARQRFLNSARYKFDNPYVAKLRAMGPDFKGWTSYDHQQ